MNHSNHQKPESRRLIIPMDILTAAMTHQRESIIDDNDCISNSHINKQAFRVSKIKRWSRILPATNRTLLLLTLYIIYFVCNPLFCLANPSITYISKDQIVDIGDEIEIKCNLIDVDGYQIGWTRTPFNSETRQATTIARGASIDVPDNRFSATYNPRNGLYLLRISQVNENDAGNYQCQIIFSGTSSSQTARTNVFVRIPPTISDNSTRSIITSVGLDVQMQCFANGFPKPTISWRRNKNVLIPINNGVAIFRGQQLNLNNITKYDRGTYYCVADNGVSPGARRGISVEVEFKPDVRVGQPRYEQALQYDADLHCTVEAFPSPSIIWLKDGQELNNNQHYSVAIFDTSNELSHTTLRVKKIEKRQYGIYVCRAANKFGYSEAEVRLDETPNVICPPACDAPNYLISSGISIMANQEYRLFLHMIVAIGAISAILMTLVPSSKW